MSRKVRTTLLVTETQLLPSIPDRELVRQREEQSKQKMKENFDRRHKAIPLPSLQKDGKVWIPAFETSGTVIEETQYPRSYRVQTPTGVLQRNRRDLVSLPRDSEPQEEQTTQNNESQSQTEFDDNTRVTTCSGPVTKPPERLMTVSS